MDYGFIRCTAVSPRLRIADISYNTAEIARAVESAAKEGSSLILFPELAICGYSCADLFQQDILCAASIAAVRSLAACTLDGPVVVVGLPVAQGGTLWNCAAVLAGGHIAGLVPKSFLPNYKEFYEARWFSPGTGDVPQTIGLDGEDIPFGTDLLFSLVRNDAAPFIFAIEICEDLWVPLPPSTLQALAGARLILNPSASTEIVGKADYRRSLVANQSGRAMAAYLYAGAGPCESTTDVVFGGHCLAAENGSILGENTRFSRETSSISIDFDLARLESERRVNTSFADQAAQLRAKRFGPHSWRQVAVPAPEWSPTSFCRRVDPHPFVPKDPRTLDERCREIFAIQVAALAKRVEHSGAKTLVIGISGGLDSTLALLVAIRTLDLLDRPRTDILGITMPGFGTTGGTLANAHELMEKLGITQREIDITASCLQHFADIGHDRSIHDVTYENVQARERTQILMDLANKTEGFVVGTGDLSEAALGWSTYNGDHMSMYAVNCSVPKTLVRHLVSWVAACERESSVAAVLEAVVATPISPELLPPDAEGKIAQKTEDLVGPYELHDFFLYHHVRQGVAPKKLLFLAEHAFASSADSYDRAALKHWLAVFYRRFFAQQFKRSCVPDGPKVGSTSLSPRGDWRMPSDASAALWLKELEEA